MTMEASFYQGAGGKDDRGNDIIYEFNGDDDMWLYIDGLLVLDIGGCHGAVSGTINFRTGAVHVGGASGHTVSTTLYQIFKDANLLPDGSAWSEEGAAKWFDGDTFADYTQHSFKMFYMERGAYASNLKMQFNLLTIEEGSLILEKKLPSAVQSAYGDQVFAYQIYTVDGNTKTIYTPPADKYVTYESSKERVVPEGQTESDGFTPSYTLNGTTYENVYFLKPGESIVLPMTDNTVQYYVREIGIDPEEYTQVKANDTELAIRQTDSTVGTTEDLSPTYVAATDVDAVQARGRVTYENYPKEPYYNLRLQKIVEGGLINKSDSFRFDVQLEDSQTGQLVPYNLGTYYIVKDVDGVETYFKYENGELVASENNEPVAHTAGISGSIDRIYPGYTILITGLLPGTDFKVTERTYGTAFPDGYEYVGKTVTNADMPSLDDSDGAIKSGATEDALVQITNASVTDFSFGKVWRDAVGESELYWPSDTSITVTIHQGDDTYATYTIGSDDLAVGTKITSNEDKVADTSAKAKLTVSTVDAEGYVFSLSGLPYGDDDGAYTYYVSEETVGGYQPPKYFTSDGDQAMGATRIGDEGIVKNDVMGYELPSTGGVGTTRLYAMGACLALVAVASLAWRRRA